MSLEWRVVTDLITPDLCRSEPSRAPRIEATPARNARVGPLEIRRALPMRDPGWSTVVHSIVRTLPSRRKYDDLTRILTRPADVSWMLMANAASDSLGSEVVLRAGGLNLRPRSGITHPRTNGSEPGAQGALGPHYRCLRIVAAFEKHPASCRGAPGGRMTVILGQAAGTASAASVFSPIVGADIELGKSSTINVPLSAEFEHCLFVLHGGAGIDGESMVPDVLYYLGTSREEMTLSSRDGARIAAPWGTPFARPSHVGELCGAYAGGKIVAATEDWMKGERFGRVPGYAGLPCLRHRFVAACDAAAS